MNFGVLELFSSKLLTELSNYIKERIKCSSGSYFVMLNILNLNLSLTKLGYIEHEKPAIMCGTDTWMMTEHDIKPLSVWNKDFQVHLCNRLKKVENDDGTTI